MRVKIVKIDQSSIDETEKAINEALKELEGFYINDIKFTDDGSIAWIMYSEKSSKRAETDKPWKK